jgi:hypothetical protein
MMTSTEVKEGTLVKTGNTLGIILQDEMKFKNYNHYARVYYFNSSHHKDNPCWVFLGSLNNIERATK